MPALPGEGNRPRQSTRWPQTDGIDRCSANGPARAARVRQSVERSCKGFGSRCEAHYLAMIVEQDCEAWPCELKPAGSETGKITAVTLPRATDLPAQDS